MFGFSIAKLLLIGLVVVVVLFGARILRSLGTARERPPAGGGSASAPPPPAPEATELAPCRVCGTYLDSAAARDCGRTGCPYAA